MSYTRVIPRDLFNEAKILKCLGHLVLKGPLLERNGFKIHQFNCDESFGIDQRSCGEMYCNNIFLSDPHGECIQLSTPLNSKLNYPLTYTTRDDKHDFVFNDAGLLSDEFLELMYSYQIN